MSERSDRRAALAKLREKGAAWQAAHTPMPPSDQPEVIFATPLISKNRAFDWDVICQNLAATVGSLRNQTSSLWRMVICGQDKPDGITFDNHVQFLPFKTPDTETDKNALTFDKWFKIRAMTKHLSETEKGDGYLFQLDADDILHPDLVAHITSDNNGQGYYITQGYMVDMDSKRMGYLGPRRLRWPFAKPFNRECGSCVAARFDFRQGPGFAEPLNARGKHKDMHENLAAYGFALEPVPFPAGLYIVNHGENIRERRGKMDAKISYLRRNLLSAARNRDVIAAFSLDSLFASKFSL
ncbi:MAG: hypothetical protein AAGK92_08130 [Pseudomonadota bacterium]